MNFNVKTTIRRSVLFFTVLIAVIFNLIFTMYVKGDSVAYWLIFWTHLSNLGVLIWATCGFVSLFIKNKNFEHQINDWFFKGLVSTFIIVTGIIFMIFAYVPLILSLTVNSNIEETANVIAINGGQADFVRNNYSAYVTLSIISTTLLHLFVPIFMAWEYFEGKGFTNKIEKKEIIDKSLILFIFPSLYFVWAILLNSLGVPGPYPILNFCNVFVDPTTENYETWFQFISLIIDLFIGIFFIFISYSLMVWSNKHK